MPETTEAPPGRMLAGHTDRPAGAQTPPLESSNANEQSRSPMEKTDAAGGRIPELEARSR